MDKKTLKPFFLGVLATTILGVFVLFFALGSTNNPFEASETSRSDGVTLSTVYHITQVRDGEVIYESETHNLITTAGLNLVKTKFGLGGAHGNVSFIGLAPLNKAAQAADTVLFEEYADEAAGLNRSTGIYAPGEGNGNWTVGFKWTAIGSANVGAFAVFNQTWPSNDSMFSIGNFSDNNNVSMLANDQLTVNVTYTVT